MKTRLALRKLVACALLAAALTVTANAQDVKVRGAETCQAFLDAKQRNAVDEAVKQLMWFLGYVSGLAVATHMDILDKDDNAELMLYWVDNYCQRYPAKYLSDAGDLYYKFRVEQVKASYAK